MAYTSRAHRARALAAAAAVAGTVVATTVHPSVAFSAVSRPAAWTGPPSGMLPAGTVVSAGTVVPAVTALSPAVGSVLGGTVVVVTGTGFRTVDSSNTAAVMFGDVPADRFVVVSDTRIVAVTPAGTGDVAVRVTGTDGTATRKPVFGYRSVLVAEFESVSVEATGGAQILADVTGADLGVSAREFAALKVTALIGASAATVTWVSATRVKITVPAAARLGVFPVKLLQNGFAGPASTGTVTYLPGIKAVVPDRVSTDGGDWVRITGAGFLAVDEGDPSAVTFGGVPAAAFGVLSATLIEAQVPAGEAGFAAVTVTSADGESLASTVARVAYVGRLSVDTSGGAFVRGSGGAHLLTVTGGTLGADVREFTAAGISVMRGKVKLAVTYVDPSHLSVVIPATTAESVALTVLSGTVAGPEVTVPVAAVVTGLSANLDAVAGGKKITVKVAGPGAAAATDFRFGDVAADCEAKPGGVFVCTVPPAVQAGPTWVRFTSGSDVAAASRFTDAALFSYTDLD